MEKKRILWVGDGFAPTGFSTVNHNIIKNLPKNKYDVHHLAINYRGDPHEYDHKMYPAWTAGDLWGYGRLVNLIADIKPDLIFILNDPWVIQEYLAKIIQAKMGGFSEIVNIPVVVYFPVDAKEHEASWYRDYAELVKAVCFYTEWGKQVVLETGVVNPEVTHVVPHGVDTKDFYPLEDIKDKNEKVIKTAKQIARESLFPIEKKPEFLNSLIFLNANRNQPRKRIDLTIKAFAEFIIGKPKNVKLYLHMGVQDMGWNIKVLARRYGFEDRLAISADSPQLQFLPVDRLNLIYNACDVGVNTSMGEGWGLTAFEHAATGAPQIVPDNSVHREIWTDGAMFIPTVAEHMYENTLTVGEVISVDGLVEIFENVYQDWKNGGEMLDELGKKAFDLTQKKEYSWKSVAKEFDKIFREVLE